MADNFLAQTLAETEDLIAEVEGEGQESRTEELLRRVLEDNRNQNADLIRQIVGQRQQLQPGVPLQNDDPFAGLEFKVDDLPNPALDPAAFHKAYIERAHGAMRGVAKRIEERAVAGAQKVLSDRELFEQAEQMVKAVEPDASKELIGIASRAVAERMRGQGLDPMAELRRNMDGVAQNVADYIGELRENLGGKARQAQSGETDRARGLLGGRNRQPAPRKGPEPKQYDPLELVKELQQLQHKHRLY